jgi:NifU-like protein involved in Fe-S cluster formation
MTRPTGSALYTPELLRLAVSLAGYPFDPAASFIGEARSPICGSTVAFSGTLDQGAQVMQPGLRVTACAVGQAAAATFVAAATGRSRTEIVAARDAIVRWIEDGDLLPDWPGFEALLSVRGYTGRHGAIPLAWNAALAALPKETLAS